MDALPFLPQPAPRVPPPVDRFARRPAAGGAAGADDAAPHVDEATKAKLRKAAGDFEAQFISQMLTPMFDSVPVDESFGGGQGEEMFRSLLVNEYGKTITGRGGFGLADQVYRELLRAQEASHG